MFCFVLFCLYAVLNAIHGVVLFNVWGNGMALVIGTYLVSVS